MADQRESIIGFIKNNGPVLPVQLSKYLNTNILFASAMLSELVSTRQIKMTRAAIGGSPLYFLPGQEAHVDGRLGNSLSGKEKEIYTILKEKKVLREKDLMPWQRVAVKQLPDFCSSMGVKYNNDIDTFWKYHLVSDEDAKNLISEILDETLSKEHSVKEFVKHLEENTTSKLTEPLAPVQQTQLIKPIVHDEIKHGVIEPEKPKIRKPKRIDSNFYESVIKFLKTSNIHILKEEIVKKNKEVDFIVSFPSAFGNLKYLVKAKSKPSVTEADISMAHSEGHIKKLPVIMLVDGKITKKAELLAEQKMQGQLTLKKI